MIDGLRKLFGSASDSGDAAESLSEPDDSVVPELSQNKKDLLVLYDSARQTPSLNLTAEPEMPVRFRVLPDGRPYTPRGVGKIYDQLGDTEVHRRARSRLRGSGANGWFNDEDVDLWFDHLSYLSYQSEACPKKSKRIHHVANIHAFCNEAYLQEISSRGEKQEDRARLLRAKTIFWPIASDNHWYLLTIQIKDNNAIISCLDGLNSHAKHGEFLQRGQALIEVLHGENHGLNITTKNLTIPMQDNAYDCGPVIVTQSNWLYKGEGFKTISDHAWCDYSQARPEMAKLWAKAMINAYVSHGKRDKRDRAISNICARVIDVDAPALSEGSIPHKRKKLR